MPLLTDHFRFALLNRRIILFFAIDAHYSNKPVKIVNFKG